LPAAELADTSLQSPDFDRQSFYLLTKQIVLLRFLIEQASQYGGFTSFRISQVYESRLWVFWCNEFTADAPDISLDDPLKSFPAFSKNLVGALREPLPAITTLICNPTEIYIPELIYREFSPSLL